MSLLPSSNLNSHGYRRHIPDYELIDDDVQEENGDDDDQHVGDHSVRTAPVFTEDTFDVLGSTNFPQKAVYGRLLSQKLGTSAEASNAINPCVYVNTNAPFSAVVCGVQGSGKSHSTSVLLESCLITDPRLGTLPEPLSGILFHFDSAAGSASAQPCEAAYLSSLHASRGGSAKALEVTVLVLPSSLRSMTRVYQDLPHVKVRPLHFAAEDISGERLLAMMKVDDGTQMPLYMEAIMAILRSMDSEDTFDYDDFRSKLFEQKFNPSQKAMLNIRLALLDSCLAGGNLQNRISNYFEKGHLTIIDLSSPYMDSTSACGFFDIILGLFIETNTGTSGKIVVLDEAHKYLSEGGGGSRLTESLLSVIRQQRHLGTRVVISTQEPTVVPAKFLELCSFVIAHRFSSPKWLQHLAKHMSAADSSMDELLSKIISLHTGQAILFSPSALCARIPDPSAAAAVYHGPSRSISKPDILPLGQGYLIVHSRQRITRDGGQSILAVQHLEDVVSTIATTDSGHSKTSSISSRPSPYTSHSSWKNDIHQGPTVKSSGTMVASEQPSARALESSIVDLSPTTPTPALPHQTIPFVRYLAQMAAQGQNETSTHEVRTYFALRGLILNEVLLDKVVQDAVACGFSICMKFVNSKRIVVYVPQEATNCNLLLLEEEETDVTHSVPSQPEASHFETMKVTDHVSLTREQEPLEEGATAISSEPNELHYGAHCFSTTSRLSSTAKCLLQYLIERHIGGRNKTVLRDVQTHLKSMGQPASFGYLFSSWHELMEHDLVRDERSEENSIELDVDSVWLRYIGCHTCNLADIETQDPQETPGIIVPRIASCVNGFSRQQHDGQIPPAMANFTKYVLQYLLDRHAQGLDQTSLQDIQSHLQETSIPFTRQLIRATNSDLLSHGLVRADTAAGGLSVVRYTGCSAGGPAIIASETKTSSVSAIQAPVQVQSGRDEPAPRQHNDPVPSSLSRHAQQLLEFLIKRHKDGENHTLLNNAKEFLQTQDSTLTKGAILKIRNELIKHGFMKETILLGGLRLDYIGCSICTPEPIPNVRSPSTPRSLDDTMSIASHMTDRPAEPQLGFQPRIQAPEPSVTERIKKLMLIAISENKFIQSWPYVRLLIGNHSLSAPKLSLVVVVSNASSPVKIEAQNMCASQDRAILLICLPDSANFEDVSPGLVKPLEIFAFAVGGTENYQNEVTGICADLRALVSSKVKRLP